MERKDGGYCLDEGPTGYGRPGVLYMRRNCKPGDI